MFKPITTQLLAPINKNLGSLGECQVNFGPFTVSYKPGKSNVFHNLVQVTSADLLRLTPLREHHNAIDEAAQIGRLRKTICPISLNFVQTIIRIRTYMPIASSKAPTPLETL